MYLLFGCRGAKRFYFFILSTRFTDHYHTGRTGTIVFLAYIHGAKGTRFFACATQNHPMILRNSLIFNVRYMMAQKSDEVRSPGLFLTSGDLFETPSAQPRFSWGNNPSNGLFRSCCSRFFAKKTSRLSSTERGWAKASTFSSAEGYSSMFKRRNTKEGSKPRPMAVRATFCLRAKGVAAWAERSLLLRNCFSVSV